MRDVLLLNAVEYEDVAVMSRRKLCLRFGVLSETSLTICGVARMWMRVKRVAVWRFCAPAGRAGKKIVAADGIPELAMFFVLWVWVAPFLTFLGVHARALTSWLAALFYSIFRWIRQMRIECNMVSRLRLKVRCGGRGR